jgi:hypothetical protein
VKSDAVTFKNDFSVSTFDRKSLIPTLSQRSRRRLIHNRRLIVETGAG